MILRHWAVIAQLCVSNQVIAPMLDPSPEHGKWPLCSPTRFPKSIFTSVSVDRVPYIMKWRRSYNPPVIITLLKKSTIKQLPVQKLQCLQVSLNSYTSYQDYNEWIDRIVSMACLAYRLGSSYKTAGLSSLLDKLLSPRNARNESATLFDSDLRSYPPSRKKMHRPPQSSCANLLMSDASR